MCARAHACLDERAPPTSRLTHALVAARALALAPLPCRTWAAETTLPNYYATSINCLAGHCYASLIDDNEDSYIAHEAAAAAKALRGGA